MSGEHWARHLFNGGVTFYEGWNDPDADYSFDLVDVAKAHDGWYLVRTTGCSCPSYEEEAHIEHGPVHTLDDLQAWLDAEYGNDRVSTYYSSLHAEVTKAINAARGDA